MELYIDKKISIQNTINFLKSQFNKASTNVHAFQLYKGETLMLRIAPSPYSNTYKRQLYSISKTFASTAIGIACDMGILKVTDKLSDIFMDDISKLSQKFPSELTVRHLLTMSAGHDKCTMKKISLSDNGVKAFFNAPFLFAPGTKYLYDTGASYMLSAVLTKLTGLSMLDFLNVHLFRHLEIENVRWPFCGGNINEGGFGLRLSADDIAKLGLLYLNKGIMKGKRLISEEWINEATSAYLMGDLTREPDWKSGYGYQIWKNEKGGYRADGAFGQYCIVVPEKDIVMVLLTESENVEEELSLCFDYMDKFFEPQTDKASENDLKDFLSNCYQPYKTDIFGTSKKKLYRLNENLNHLTYAETENTGKVFNLTFSDGANYQTISAGNGQWLENKILLRGFKPQLYELTSDTSLEDCLFLASYKNSSDSITEIELRFLDCPHTIVLNVAENKGTLSVSIDARTDVLPEIPFSLEGIAVSN